MIRGVCMATGYQFASSEKKSRYGPSDAMAGFLARPGEFFDGSNEVRKTAPECVLSRCVMRYVRGLPQYVTG